MVEGNPFMEALSGSGRSSIKRDKIPNPPKGDYDRLPPPAHKLHLRTHREVKGEMVRVYTLMAHNHIPVGKATAMINSLRAIGNTMAEAVAVARAEQMMEIERLEARIIQLREIVERTECLLSANSTQVPSLTHGSTSSSED